MAENINYWTSLADCPLDISMIEKYAKEFETHLPEKIQIDNINKAKEGVLNARACLDSMITSLIQLLYDKDILTDKSDYALFWMLTDNLGRFMKKLDEDEENLIIRFDEPNPNESRVGISRVSAYAKRLKIANDSLVYDCLYKSTKEYLEIKNKDPRKFLYILFQIIQVTLTVLGGLTREKGSLKKGTIMGQSPSWRFLMSNQGQEQIQQEYKEDTGIDLNKLNLDFDLEGDIEDETNDSED